VDADFTRLEQTVVNLLLNAVKFSPPGRRIKMTVEGADGEAVVSITDNGIGIAPECWRESLSYSLKRSLA